MTERFFERTEEGHSQRKVYKKLISDAVCYGIWLFFLRAFIVCTCLFVIGVIGFKLLSILTSSA